MDLYFPDIHIGIEVDEADHKNNQESDLLRMDDIISAVSETEANDFLILRIDASEPIDVIHHRIDEVVQTIETRMRTIDLKWLTYDEELKALKKKDSLSVYDAITFSLIKDIANTIFGRNMKGCQISCFKIREHTWLWCPQLSIMKKGEKTSAAGGWINSLAEDWSYIDETHIDPEKMDKRKEKAVTEAENKYQRAVFAKFRNRLGMNRYRFVGVFQITGVSPDHPDYVRYIRVDENIKIT